MPTGVQAAAAYLRELLLRPGRYRRKWEQYAERSRRGQVNQLAVAEVLAHYLWEHPRAQGDVDVLPRQLKDTASRALSGKLLSQATLTLFTDAFGFGTSERERLLKLWEGSARRRSRRWPCTTITTWARTGCRSGTGSSTSSKPSSTASTGCPTGPIPTP